MRKLWKRFVYWFAGDIGWFIADATPEEQRDVSRLDRLDGQSDDRNCGDPWSGIGCSNPGCHHRPDNWVEARHHHLDPDTGKIISTSYYIHKEP